MMDFAEAALQAELAGHWRVAAEASSTSKPAAAVAHPPGSGPKKGNVKSSQQRKRASISSRSVFNGMS